VRPIPFWPVAALSWVTWFASVVLLWGTPERPIPPVSLVVVVALFYLPALLTGIWAGHPLTIRFWSRGRLAATCLLTPIAFSPFALLTFPLLPYTLGALVLPIGILIGAWRHARTQPSASTALA
jgi:hypothetical protein